MSFFRLRQSVAVKELINAKTKHLLPMGGQSIQGTANNSSPFMRKTVSVPNISHVSTYLTIRPNTLRSCISINKNKAFIRPLCLGNSSGPEKIKICL